MESNRRVYGRPADTMTTYRRMGDAHQEKRGVWRAIVSAENDGTRLNESVR
jgi:hypothetical protein